MKYFLLSLILFTQSAHAAGISIETRSQEITNLSQVLFHCDPGIPSNGHNYPTSSSITFDYIYAILPDSNVNSVYVSNDFSGDAGELGDHCAELTEEFTKILPATMTLTKTQREVHYKEGGNCLNELVETVTGKMGKFDLESGSQVFVLGILDSSACAQ